MRALTDSEFHETFSSPMTGVALDDTARLLCSELVGAASAAAKLSTPPLLECVYASGDRRHLHVLHAVAGQANVYLVLVLDRESTTLVGYHLLDLSEKYGLV